ncbi:MAG TPA: alkaline phosphatase D family protein [Ilumatobacteraceae bacterium]|nr:alkaline phosphatase D family protein [Ilumatobacteraceae bacterium]
MPSLLLGPLLRYVSSRAATIWVEVDQPCTVSVLGVDQSTFSFAGHHYALVVLTDLPSEATIPYQVQLDGEQHWPPIESTMPPSCIRTLSREHEALIAFGSCRAIAPHEDPFTRERIVDKRGIGYDAMRAIALRMVEQVSDEWPDLMLMLGDQVYADESSPATQARIDQRQRGDDDPPPRVVANFEEYTWLYREAWTPEAERWMLSVTPTAMIFDDHDMIDDWNISNTWVQDIRGQKWWPEHVIGGLVSYWIYQHLGNLSPETIAAEGMLADVIAEGDATDYLRRWALESEKFTPIPGGYQFSFDRHVGNAHVVIIDDRNGRVLDPAHRRMVDAKEWRWILETCDEPTDHLVLAMSLPLMVPGGLHGFQQWSERRCDGTHRMHKAHEWLRRALDLEDWAAFDISFREFEELLIQIGTDQPDSPAPRTISMLAGDIHFAYVAEVTMPEGVDSRVRQMVSSPMRNTLARHERLVLRAAVSRGGRRLGNALMRRAGRDASRLTWEIQGTPIFRNNIGSLHFHDTDGELRIETAHVEDDQVVVDVAFSTPL